MVKRAPTILEYLHASPGTYPTIDRPMPRAPVDRLSGRWDQGPPPQFLNRPPPDDLGELTPRLLGPGGIVDAPYEGPQAPHVSLARALASPMASPGTPPPDQVFASMAPHEALPGGGHFDSGVAPGAPGITGGTAPGGYMNHVDMANASNPLRLPRHIQPGQASAPVRGMFDDKIGDVLLRLLGVSG